MRDRVWRVLGRDAAVCAIAWVSFVAVVAALRQRAAGADVLNRETARAARLYETLRDCPASDRPLAATCEDRLRPDSATALDDDTDYYVSAYLATRLFNLNEAERAIIDGGKDAPPDRARRLTASVLQRGSGAARATPEDVKAVDTRCERLVNGAAWLCRVLEDPTVRAQLLAVAQGERAALGRLLRLRPVDLMGLETEHERDYFRRMLLVSGLREYARADPDVLAVLHKGYLQLRHPARADESWTAAVTQTLGAAFTSSFARALASTLLFVAIVAACIVLLGYWFMALEIRRSPLRKAAFALALPTFAAGAILKQTIKLDPNQDQLLSYVCALLCAVVASGVSFELVQVLSESVRKEEKRSYMVGLRTFGLGGGLGGGAGGAAAALGAVSSYVAGLLKELIAPGRGNRFRSDGRPPELTPFFFRASDYHNTDHLKRRLPFVLDSMLVVGIMFGLTDTLSGCFVESVRTHDLIPLMQGVTGLLAISLLFKWAGSLIHHRLFQ